MAANTALLHSTAIQTGPTCHLQRCAWCECRGADPSMLPKPCRDNKNHSRETATLNKPPKRTRAPYRDQTAHVAPRISLLKGDAWVHGQQVEAHQRQPEGPLSGCELPPAHPAQHLPFSLIHPFAQLYLSLSAASSWADTPVFRIIHLNGLQHTARPQDFAARRFQGQIPPLRARRPDRSPR